jgi:hypothetical protein
LGSFWQQQFESTEIISKAIALQSDGEMGCSKTITIQKMLFFLFAKHFAICIRTRSRFKLLMAPLQSAQRQSA